MTKVMVSGKNYSDVKNEGECPRGKGVRSNLCSVEGVVDGSISAAQV